MTKRLLAAAIAAAAILVVSAGTASAAVEFGSSCAGNGVAPGEYTLMTLSAPSSVVVGSPIDGVITKVKTRVELLGFSGSAPTLIKTLKPAGGNSYTAVDQAIVQVANGVTEAAVRLPVKSGYRLGLHGLPFTYEGSPTEGFSFYCSGAPESALGAASGDVPPGSTAEFMNATEGQVPISAVVEPDADNDGYGDETQDGCPQSAAFQGACPTVTLDAISLAGKTKITVYVAVSTPAPVQVLATGKAGKKKVSLSSPTQTVEPGKLTPFTLKFTKPLKKRLKELPPSKKLTLKITASATNVAGQVSTDLTKAKLKGQS